VDSDGAVQPDTNGADAVSDSGETDVVGQPDAVPVDVAAGDTTPNDVAEADTATTDTATGDTAVADTLPTDAVVLDVASLDGTAGDSSQSQAPVPAEYHYPVRTPANPHGVTVGVTFDMPMDLTSLTANTVDAACSGALQVSFDNFDTCLKMFGHATPHAADPNRYELVSAGLPPSRAPLALRIDATVRSAAGVAMGWVSTSPAIAGPYHHTIMVDGTNDFAADEALTTSSAGHSAWLAWDADYVYLGFESPDLAADNNETWFFAYVGAPGVAGTREGVLYNTQSPALPFDARLHIQWRANDDYGASLSWVGSGWGPVDLGLGVGAGNVATNGAYLELRLPLSALGLPTGLRLVMGMLREQGFNEATWATVPAGSAADGYDPDFMNFISASLFYRNVTIEE